MPRSTALLLSLILISGVACADMENVGSDGRGDGGDRDAASSSDASGDSDEVPLTFDAPTDDAPTHDTANSFDGPANDTPSTSDAPTFDFGVSDTAAEADSCGAYTRTGDYGPGFVFCCDGADLLVSYLSCTPVTITGNCMAATTTAGPECGSMNCTSCPPD